MPKTPTELPWQHTQPVATVAPEPAPMTTTQGTNIVLQSTQTDTEDGLTYCGKCYKFTEVERFLQHLFKNAMQRNASFSVPVVQAQLSGTEVGRTILLTKTALNVHNKIKHLRKKYKQLHNLSETI